MNPMKTLESGCFIIIGRTPSGKPFRPSDWDHRLCGALSLFNEASSSTRKKSCPFSTSSARLFMSFAASLKESNPAMWKFVLGFAQGNEMQIEWPDTYSLPSLIRPGAIPRRARSGIPVRNPFLASP